MKTRSHLATRVRTGWSAERRQKHAEAIRRWKPWLKSTGLKTEEGKNTSKMNAFRHGGRSAHTRAFEAMLAGHNRFLKDVRKLIADRKQSRKRTIGTGRPQLLQNPDALPIYRPMWTVAALYRFVELTDLPALQAALKDACAENGICGTILIAPEGVNGTIAGIGEKLTAVIDILDRYTGIKFGELKYSTSTGKPFLRMKVRIKKEIITMAAPEADPTKRVGTYVEPADWNALIADPDVTLIDTRNDYETAVGIFRGALDPNIAKFTDFKDYVASNLDPAKHKKVAMFCTGGIRCEKASSFMLAHGFEEVYHLKGGILKYLETVPPEQSRWDGECFVFDRRVAVGHGLEEGVHDICYGCRFPLAPGDRDQPSFEPGVSCPRCIDSLTKEKAASLRMRHEQFSKRGAVAKA